MIEFGKYLKGLREKKGISMSAFSKEIGSSSGTVSDWENKNRIPRIETLKKISEYFKVDFSELKKYSHMDLNNANEVEDNPDITRTALDLKAEQTLRILDKMSYAVESIQANLIETRHGVEMNQALSKANLYQSAKLELIATKPGQWTKKDHQSIVKDLDALTARIFEGIGV